jgi:hypothetical protein
MENDNKPLIIDTPEGMRFLRLLQLRAALKMEVKGIKMTRYSICKIVKDEFGFTGNKAKVLEQFDAYVNSVLEAAEQAKAQAAEVVGE